MTGMSFETIAKWIGHANPSTTSGVYGRLAEHNIESMMVGVPFVSSGGSSDQKAEWQAVAEFLHEPFVFRNQEWQGLSRHMPTAARSGEDNTDRILREAEAAIAMGRDHRYQYH